MRVDTDRMRRDADAELKAATERHRAAIKRAEAIERLASGGESGIEESKNAPAPASLVGSGVGMLPKEVPGFVARHELGEVRLAIREILADAPTGLSKAQITAELHRRFPESNGELDDKRKISRTLNRMKTAGETRLMRKQRGTVPAIHGLVKQE